MFDHEHHGKILSVLDALDPSIFEKTGTCFGGGTLIALLHDEYRWSEGIGFRCPVGPGYRDLRKAAAQAGHAPTFLFQNVDGLEFPRELRADQYGIRFLVIADGTPIKFEIVTEARIELGEPERFSWLNTPCLNRVDRYAEKLLANADRWADSAIESRDLIDLAVLRLHEGLCDEAIAKAEEAYPVVDPLGKALQKFQSSQAYRGKCFDALQIRDRSLIIDGIDLLATDQGMGRTERSRDEL
ncbi:nucleotidyl transferase AbiEii/AbiGii toxin family protein [Alloalcanivorax gelatiniphagus]|uniref:nucleotidyl transferase AbiEii/AbiGii toxin family protein n=1 Tax=Alloalcanivorax gelatiniphagus TaxID=1194167 RepID=UPI00197A9743|nr:nucleotidyl transferase AbiEii/AbiGii toxin family protein [Alloalcanivorax gelatiniphagus]